jgi:hypothetical protein
MRALIAGRCILAGLWGSCVVAGCHKDSRQPPAASSVPPSAVGAKCHAGWPMPNTPASGLPNPQSYDAADPEVVRDRVTGLWWQRVVDPDDYGVVAATAYCEALILAGHHDWRLPALIELASIADLSRANPAADPVAFPDTPPASFWSSQANTGVGNTGLAWYVLFQNGGAYGGNDAHDRQRVRCVRGHTSCTDLDVSPYSVAGDLVHDDFTGLTWQREVDPTRYPWQEAKDHCSELRRHGTGWRLPSVGELLTLVDFTKTEPALDRSAFPNTPSEFFWSSSPSLLPPGTAWGVSFIHGSEAASAVATPAWTRCVR